MNFTELSTLASQHGCTLLRARDTNGIIKSGYRLMMTGGGAKRFATLQQVWKHIDRFYVQQARRKAALP